MKKKVRITWGDKYAIADLDFIGANVNEIVMKKLIVHLMTEKIYVFLLNENNPQKYNDYAYKAKQIGNVLGIEFDMKNLEKVCELLFIEPAEAVWIVNSPEDDLLSMIDIFPNQFQDICEFNYFKSILHYWSDENSLIYTFRTNNKRSKYIEVEY